MIEIIETIQDSRTRLRNRRDKREALESVSLAMDFWQKEYNKAFTLFEKEKDKWKKLGHLCRMVETEFFFQHKDQEKNYIIWCNPDVESYEEERKHFSQEMPDRTEVIAQFTRQAEHYGYTKDEVGAFLIQSAQKITRETR